MTDFTVNPDASVYYASGYWNDLPQVSDHLQRTATGSAEVRWFEHLRLQVGRSFDKALVLNCGNGWVERDLVRAGVVAEAVGIDFSSDLLKEARKEAEADALPLRYYECDTNAAEFPEGGYDLVVNYAAAHHIAYIDRVMRRLCEMLPEDGVLVSWDYVGPHRNQYHYAEWQAAADLNSQLPAEYQQEMGYPHLPTMLASDPTEAIHSELILETVTRYFELAQMTPLGGAIAYPLLTFNKGVHGRPGPDRDAVVERVLATDIAYTAAHPGATLFAFFWGRPKKRVLDQAEQLADWSQQEERRETNALRNGGHYYRLTVLQQLTQEVEDLRIRVSHVLADLTRESSAPVPAPAVAPTLRHRVVAQLDRRPALKQRLARLRNLLR